MQTEFQFGQIGVIGCGDLGHALGEALTRARLQVLYYDKDPKLTTTGSIEDLIRSCQLLLLCVPSWEVQNVLKQISRAANPAEARTVICFAKGVEPGFTTMDDVLAKHMPANYIRGLMSGPLLAEEISDGRVANGIVALSNNAAFVPLKQNFAAADIFIEATTDMRGIALCAVLKNIYAIAFGVSDGLRFGLNAKGRLAVIALAETKRLLEGLGGDSRTAEGTAGLGDLLAVGFSDVSFNYRIGKGLAEGIASEHLKSEGLVALHELRHKVKLANYPLANMIDQITFHYGDPHKLLGIITGS